MASLRHTVRGIAFGVAVLCSLTGCAATSGTSTTSTSSARSATAPATATATAPITGTSGSSAVAPTGSIASSPAPVRPSPRPVSPTTPKAGQRVTLTGTVTAGVAHGCLILTDDRTGTRVNLTGGDQTILKVGATVTVVGSVRSDLMSYCQQGAIFQVLSATPAG